MVQCDVLDRLGVRHVELRSAWGVNVSALDDAQVERLRRLFESHGIGVSSIGSPIGKIRITDDFEPHLAAYRRCLELAELFDAPYLRMFSFFMPRDSDPVDHRDEVMRRLGALVELASATDTVLLHENEKHIYGDIPSRCLDIVETMGSDHLRLIWDPANFVQCGVKPFSEGYESLRPYVTYLHIKDARMEDGTVWPAGQGDGEVVATLAALREDGFDGFLSLEPHLAQEGPAGPEGGDREFARAHRALTGVLSSLGVPWI